MANYFTSQKDLQMQAAFDIYNQAYDNTKFCVLPESLRTAALDAAEAICGNPYRAGSVLALHAQVGSAHLSAVAAFLYPFIMAARGN